MDQIVTLHKLARRHPVFTKGDRDGLCKSLILLARLDLLNYRCRKSTLFADKSARQVRRLRKGQTVSD